MIHALRGLMIKPRQILMKQLSFFSYFVACESWSLNLDVKFKSLSKWDPRRPSERSYIKLSCHIMEISTHDIQLQNERQVFVMLFCVLVLKDKSQKQRWIIFLFWFKVSFGILNSAVQMNVMLFVFLSYVFFYTFRIHK